MYGLAGNDILTGRAGVDLMNGGEGSDVYIVRQSDEHTVAEVVDTGLTGIDAVRFSATSGTLVLFAGDTGLELLVLGTGTKAAAVITGTAAVSADASALGNGLEMIGNNGANTLLGTGFDDLLTGNRGNDILSGGEGNDILSGGLGNDILTGGAGLDIFLLDTAPRASSNLDTIVDFNAAEDTIKLDATVFTALAAAFAPAVYVSVLDDDVPELENEDEDGDEDGDAGLTYDSLFISGDGLTTAVDANDHLIYNTATGSLYYDADGSGSVEAIQIASFSGTPLLTLDNFWVL